ncbi:cytochrome b/b6 domain-containing protein [Pseudomonadota bacterium]
MTFKAVKVWDPLVRIFHWSLVSLFLIAYATEDDFLSFHVVAGYLICGLIAFRLIWGVIGSRHARFTDFVKSPKEIKAYIKDVLLFRAKHYLGHNPAGGAMVIALLLSITVTLITGMLTYGATEFSGPLAIWTTSVGDHTADFFEETHEFFANFTVLLVVMHVAGVMIASLQHRENLVRSMIDGDKYIKTTHTSTQTESPKTDSKQEVMQ